MFEKHKSTPRHPGACYHSPGHRQSAWSKPRWFEKWEQWCSNDLIQRCSSYHHMIFNSFIDACYCNYELFTVSFDWGNGWSLQVCETRIRCKAISPVSLWIKVADGFRSQAMWNMFAKGTYSSPIKRVSEECLKHIQTLSANAFKLSTPSGHLWMARYAFDSSIFCVPPSSEVHVMKSAFLSTNFCQLKRLHFLACKHRSWKRSKRCHPAKRAHLWSLVKISGFP